MVILYLLLVVDVVVDVVVGCGVKTCLSFRATTK